MGACCYKSIINWSFLSYSDYTSVIYWKITLFHKISDNRIPCSSNLIYQTGSQSPILFQFLLLSEAERRSSICSLKSEITSAIIKITAII